MSDDLLEAYVDGVLEGDDLAAFQARLADDPALQAQVEQQERVDASLKQRFTAPSPEASLAAALEQAERPTLRPWQWVGPLLAAAAILVAVLLGRPWGGHVDPPATPRPSLQGLYQLRVASGFKPYWVCKDDAELQQTFKKRLGLALSLPRLPSGAQAIGLVYDPAFSEDTTVILAELDGKKAMVFVDRLDRDRAVVLPAGSDLHVHRRELGGLVLYELSPLPAPRLLAAFEAP